AGSEVLRRGVAVGEQPGRLEHHLDAEILPRQLCGILDREDLEFVAVDRNRVLLRFHRRVQIAEHRIVFEQMRECLRAGEIVDRDEVDLPVAERSAHDVAPDATESVDSYPDRHRYPPGQTFHSTISALRCTCSTAR